MIITAYTHSTNEFNKLLSFINKFLFNFYYYCHYYYYYYLLINY